MADMIQLIDASTPDLARRALAEQVIFDLFTDEADDFASTMEVMLRDVARRARFAGPYVHLVRRAFEPSPREAMVQIGQLLARGLCDRGMVPRSPVVSVQIPGMVQ
jgi:hypothetical protein